MSLRERLSGRDVPLPHEQDIEALLVLGARLLAPAKAEEGWLGWCATSPLAPGLDEAIKLPSLVEHIEDELPHLAQVCRAPRTHIQLDTERVAIGRARRIDARASVWLAGHTEDWGHRTITGVQPRRILAQVREEQWDLYENLVAARLIDHLVAWLRRRLWEVRRLRDDVFARMESFHLGTAAYRRRIERICRLWGESWEAASGRERADELHRRLEALLYRLLPLLDSPLYRHVPRRATVPRALRRTNLFANDDHYRGVARLWRAWSQETAARIPTAAELERRRHDLIHGFDAWCMLLVVRACHQLGLEPRDEDAWITAIRPGCAICLADGHELHWRDDGAIELTAGGRTALRFVPLVHALEAIRNAAARVACIDEIVTIVSDSISWTVVLHPAVPGCDSDELAGVANPPLPDVRGAIDFIRVSPFSLDSVERVARAVRWATLAPRMLAYPPRISQIPGTLRERVAGWFDEHANTCVRPPRPEERRGLNLEAQVHEAGARLDALQRELEQVIDERGRHLDDRRKLSDFNRRKSSLQKERRDAEIASRELFSFKEELDRALGELSVLMRCPVCRCPGDLDPRDSDCFQGRCRTESCSAVWGVRRDPESGRRIPFVHPGDVIPADISWAESPARVDETLGCDVLAIPVLQPGRKEQYVPPRITPRGSSWPGLSDRATPRLATEGSRPMLPR